MKLRSVMITLALLLGGCVSQPMPEGFERSDDFDQVEAAKTRISLGLTYLKNGNFSQAKQNLDRALEFAPRLADSHYSIAYYYQLVGEVSRAEEAYDNALKLAPRNPDIANSYGAFLCQQSRYKEAKEFFNKAVNSQTYSSSAETYENMALCSLSQSRPDDALEYLHTALKHSPSRAKSLFLLTEVLVSEKQYEEAKATLVRYQRVARVSPNSLWLAVQIESGLNQPQNAKGYGDMLLSLYPGHAATQKYRDEMVQLIPVAQVVSKPKPPPVTIPEPPPKPSPTMVKPDTSSTPVAELNDVVSEAPPEVSMKAVSTAVIETPVEPNQIELDSFQSALQHIVQTGENLYRISLKYNVRMDRLIEWNQLEASGKVFQGQQLWIVDPAQANNAQE